MYSLDDILNSSTFKNLSAEDQSTVVQKYGEQFADVPAWEDIESSDAYRSLPSEDKYELRKRYSKIGEVPEEKSDLWRGVKTTFKQVPMLGYGLLAGAGAVGEKVFGEDGVSTAIKDKGVEGYKEWGQKISEDAKATDNLDFAWNEAKGGNFGALVDWLQYGLGYTVGQGSQLLATGGAGGVAAKTLGKKGVEKLAQGLVKKEIARIASTEAGKHIAKDEIAKLAVRNVAGKIGQTTALAGTAYGMEGGEIFGGLVSENEKVSGTELAKAFGASAAAGSLEFVGDKLGFDLILGKSPLLAPARTMTGLKGKAARAGIGVTAGAPIEGGTEWLQTQAEEYGQGGEPFSEEANRGAFNAAALGALGGTVYGGVGGVVSKPAPTEVLKAESVDEAIDTFTKSVKPEKDGILGTLEQASNELSDRELVSDITEGFQDVQAEADARKREYNYWEMAKKTPVTPSNSVLAEQEALTPQQVEAERVGRDREKRETVEQVEQRRRAKREDDLYYALNKDEIETDLMEDFASEQQRAQVGENEKKAGRDYEQYQPDVPEQKATPPPEGTERGGPPSPAVAPVLSSDKSVTPKEDTVEEIKRKALEREKDRKAKSITPATPDEIATMQSKMAEEEFKNSTSKIITESRKETQPVKQPSNKEVSQIQEATEQGAEVSESSKELPPTAAERIKRAEYPVAPPTVQAKRAQAKTDRRNFSALYTEGKTTDAAKNIANSNSRKEITGKLDDIFGTIEQAEKSEMSGDGYTRMMDIALDYRADIEYAANNRDWKEVKTLLEKVQAEERGAIPDTGQAEAGNVQPAPTIFPITENTDKTILIKGDPEAIRSRLAAAGIKNKGTYNAKEGGLVFNKRHEAAVREALGDKVFFAKESKDGKNLYAAHNLSADNLRHALDIGGLAAPSIAVPNIDAGVFTSFGEITLLADPSLLFSARTKTFDADVYSPRHPRSVNVVDGDAYVKLIGSIGDVHGLSVPSVSDIEESKGHDVLMHSDAIKYAWLRDNGINVPLKKMKVDAIVRRVAKMNGSGYELEQSLAVKKLATAKAKKDLNEVPEDARKEIGEYWLNEDGQAKFTYIRDIVGKAMSYRESGGIDVYELRGAVSKKFRNKLRAAGFEKYARKEFDKLIKERKLFKGFTNAGNRRYAPYTLDNIVKEMTRELRGGEGFNYGAGSIRSSFAKQFRNIKELQKNRDRVVSESEMDKIKEESQQRLSDLLDELRPYYKFDATSFGYMDDASSAIAEGPRGLREAFDLPAEMNEKIREFTDYLKNLPTEYFEAKIQRGVSVSEFNAAVVPYGTDEALVNALKNRGLKVSFYKEGDKGARAKAIKRSAVMFAKGPTKGKSTVQQVKRYLRRAMTAEGIESLLDAGKVKIVQSVEELKGILGRKGAFLSVGGYSIPDNIVSELEKIHPEVSAFISQRGDHITLSELQMPKEIRGQGIGSQFMDILTQYADANGLTISLTAAGDYGGSKAGQERFYKRHGFVKNKGRNKDYRISDNMIRRPVEVKYAKDGSILGATYQGTSYLVADNLNRTNTSSTLIHELTHGEIQENGWKGLLGKQYDRILAQVERMRQAGHKGLVEAREKAVFADNDIKKPKGVSINDLARQTFSPEIEERLAEEQITYFVGSSANQNTTLFRRIMQAINSWLIRKGIKRQIRADDLVDLAQTAIRRRAAEVRESRMTGQFRDEDMIAVFAKEYGIGVEEAQRQYDEVEKQYRGTDQWMKAPNGKPTNLNERQWVQVRTPAFKEWFGDWEKHSNAENPEGSLWADENVSKVVDDNFEPLVVYHGTERGGFSAFDEYEQGANTANVSNGFYFTEDRWNASTYSGSRDEAVIQENIGEIDEDGYEIELEHEPGVYSVFLNIKTPLESDFEGRNWDGSDENGDYVGESVPQVENDAHQSGNDGAIITNVSDEGRHGQGYHWGEITYIAFSPNQIKSAISNSGQFSPYTDNISFSKDGKPIQRITADMLNSKSFKDWQGNSFIKDPVFHGTDSKGFLQEGSWIFDSTKGKSKHHSPLAGLGNFFAVNRTEAIGYTSGGEGVVRPFYVSVENPLILNSHDPRLNRLKTREDAAAFAKRMELRGHDGIYLQDQDHVIVFDSGDIKSAEMNTGEFDRGNKDARFAHEQPLITGIRDRVSLAEPDVKEKLHDLYTYFVDKDAPKARLQKQLGKQKYDADYLEVERLRGKKVADEVEQFKQNTIVPLLKKLKDNNLQIADAEELAYSEHVPEANLRLRRVRAKSQIQQLKNYFTEKEWRPFADKLFDIESTFDEKTEIQDEYVNLLEEIESNIPAYEESIKELEGSTRKDADKILRNAQRRLAGQKKILETWNDIKDRLAGITDQEAAEIIDKWKADKRYGANKEAVKEISRINDEKLKILYESGDINLAQYDAIKNAYEHYVPLYRDGYDDGMIGTGRVTGPTGKPIKVRAGSVKGVVNILANTVNNYQNAITRKYKLEAGETLYNMVLDNPDAGWRVEDVQKQPTLDDAGNLTYYPDLQEPKNGIFVKIQGERKLITVPKDDKVMMDFLNSIKETDAPVGLILQQFYKVNRFLAALNTSLSPEFIVSNFSRDIQTALINMEDSEAAALQKRVLKRVPSMIRQIYRSERGKEVSALYRDFAKNGGKIGWMQSYEKVADLASELESELKHIDDGTLSLKNLKNFINAANTAVENGVRLATYAELTGPNAPKGVTRRKAAKIVSDLTVDFTRRGKGGAAANALYMFFNASVQGNARMIKALTRSSKVRKIISGVFAFGFASHFLGILMGGDDDDGESYYEKMKRTDPYTFNHAMVFMMPGGKAIKIPMPYLYNIFYAAGNETAAAVDAVISGKNYSPGKGTARIGTAMLDSLNPMQGATILQTLSPTVADPIVQVFENKAWHGGPLMPEKNPFGNPTPDSERYFKTVNPVFRKIAEEVNRVTGGDKVKPGLIDVSPESIEMVAETFTGSLGRFAKDTASLPHTLTQDKIESRKLPFVRRVFTELHESADGRIYRENADSVLQLKEQLRAYPERKDEYKKDKRFKLIVLTNEVEKGLSKLYKAQRTLEANEKTESAEKVKEKIRKIQRVYNKKYNDILNK